MTKFGCCSVKNKRYFFKYSSEYTIYTSIRIESQETHEFFIIKSRISGIPKMKFWFITIFRRDIKPNSEVAADFVLGPIFLKFRKWCLLGLFRTLQQTKNSAKISCRRVQNKVSIIYGPFLSRNGRNNGQADFRLLLIAKNLISKC